MLRELSVCLISFEDCSCGCLLGGQPVTCQADQRRAPCTQKASSWLICRPFQSPPPLPTTPTTTNTTTMCLFKAAKGPRLLVKVAGQLLDSGVHVGSRRHRQHPALDPQQRLQHEPELYGANPLLAADKAALLVACRTPSAVRI